MTEKEKKVEKLNELLSQINNKHKNTVFKIDDSKLEKRVFEKQPIDYKTILVYYDADCWVCFEELKSWKKIISRFEKLNSTINIRFLLFSNDEKKTSKNLKEIDFPITNSIIFNNNSVLKQYEHLEIKPYNTMLLGENKEIILIGSPLNSENLRKYYIKNIIEN